MQDRELLSPPEVTEKQEFNGRQWTSKLQQPPNPLTINAQQPAACNDSNLKKDVQSKVQEFEYDWDNEDEEDQEAVSMGGRFNIRKGQGKEATNKNAAASLNKINYNKIE